MERESAQIESKAHANFINVLVYKMFPYILGHIMELAAIRRKHENIFTALLHSICLVFRIADVKCVKKNFHKAATDSR